MQFMMEAAYAQSLEQLTPERLTELTECARQYWYRESQS